MREWLVAISMVGGSVFMFLAALGIVRLPDFFLRAQVATKAYTAGLGGLMAAAALYFGDTPVITRATLVVVFVFLTAPVATHALARAAYWIGISAARPGDCDELRGRYDPRTHALSGDDSANPSAPDPPPRDPCPPDADSQRSPAPESPPR